MNRFCPNCTSMEVGVYCSQCGTELVAMPVCRCGVKIYPSDKFCRSCGSPREEALAKSDDGHDAAASGNWLKRLLINFGQGWREYFNF